MKVKSNYPPVPVPPDYARVLQAIREGSGTTQTELAEKLHVSTMSISHWENGERSPRLHSLIAWAKALNAELTIQIEAREAKKKLATDKA